jgi:hypothetical protein
MKYTMLMAAAALAVGAASTAHAENEQSPYSAVRPAYADSVTGGAENTYPEAGSSAASLSALRAEWNRASFNPPIKPTQYRVYGRNGYVTSGPGYNAMVSLMRFAVNDTREGRARDAQTKIAKARNLLAASNLRQE